MKEKPFDYMKYGLRYLSDDIREIKDLEQKAKTDIQAAYCLEQEYRSLEESYFDENHNIRRFVCNQPQIFPGKDGNLVAIPNCGNMERLLVLLVRNHPEIINMIFKEHKQEMLFKEKLKALGLDGCEEIPEEEQVFDADEFFKNALSDLPKYKAERNTK